MTAPIPPALPGVYALLFRLDAPIQIARHPSERIALPAGSYVYIGSAFGPGGLAARVIRHMRPDKVRHWHIDHLTVQAPPYAALAWPARRRGLECAWVQQLLRSPGAGVPIPGFGSSDCRAGCPAHLIQLS